MLSRQGAYLRFWGVRGSHASPFPSHAGVGGNTSCVEIRSGRDSLICDAGTGIIPFGYHAVADSAYPRRLFVVLTHYHWDHICGLPFFVPAFTKEWQIRFFGPGDTVQEVKQNLDSQMQPPYFPVGTESWVADISYSDPSKMSLHWGEMCIDRFGVHHPGLTYGYRIKVQDKLVVYVSDNECTYRDQKQAVQGFGSGQDHEEQTLLQQIENEEYMIHLGGIRGADILIHDAQYMPEDYAKKRGWGHSCYVDVVHVAIDAGVKHLYLYHHDPANDDAAIDRIHAECLKIIASRRSSLSCHIAREGDVLNLSP